jgi:lysophospholipid acyltransferase (LPLAT)-like uncharacterized protein
MKQAIRKLLKHPLTRGVLSLFISLLLRLIYGTSRVRMHIPDNAKPYMSGEKQAIFCVWHGNMIMQTFSRPKHRPIKVLISHHRDGALITDILQWFDIKTVRGSTRKAGVAAIRELMGNIEQGVNIVITPDGPRGPVYQVTGGAAWLAKQTGLPLIPIAFGCTRGKQFNSWDQFLMPFPFGKISYVVGEPIMPQAAPAEDDASTSPTDNDNAQTSEILRIALMQCMQDAADKAPLL